MRARLRQFWMWFWGHDYYSTACLHGEHAYCNSSEAKDAIGAMFLKIPGQCKFCSRPCICKCHKET